jgi:hypothetical protein
MAIDDVNFGAVREKRPFTAVLSPARGRSKFFRFSENKGPQSTVTRPTDDSSSSDEQQESLSGGETNDGSAAQPESPTPQASDDAASQSRSETSDEGESDELPETEPLTPELVEDEAIRGDFMIRWAVILLAALLACTEIADTTTIVRIKTGQYIASHGMWPPANDVFSYTAAERPWVNLSWMFDVTLAGLYYVVGATGLSVIQALIVGITFGVIVHNSRSGVSTWWGSVAAAGVLLVCFPQFAMRPELVTLLCLAVVLLMLNRWREASGTTHLWWLVPLFVVWANFDSRMFLGLALLLLYAAGQSVGRMFGRAGQLDTPAVKHLWCVVGACLLASLVNPSGYGAVLSPLSLYGVEYPAFRFYYGASCPSDYLPMTSELFWQGLSYNTIAGLLLAVAALVTLSLNWERVDWGYLFAFVGFSGFSMAAGHELAAASIVFCVIATLNAQCWYQENFRQTYSVEMSELIFSRVGRAVTVVVLFAMAYLSVSGRLGGPAGRRTGLGLHSSLNSAISGLDEDLANSYDDRPGRSSDLDWRQTVHRQPPCAVSRLRGRGFDRASRRNAPRASDTANRR